MEGEVRDFKYNTGELATLPWVQNSNYWVVDQDKCHKVGNGVHIVAQLANRYIVAFHVAISYDILLTYQAATFLRRVFLNSW